MGYQQRPFNIEDIQGMNFAQNELVISMLIWENTVLKRFFIFVFKLKKQMWFH